MTKSLNVSFISTERQTLLTSLCLWIKAGLTGRVITQLIDSVLCSNVPDDFCHAAPPILNSDFRPSRASAASDSGHAAQFAAYIAC